MKILIPRLSMVVWYLAGAATAIVILAAGGIAVAALRNSPAQQPLPTPYASNGSPVATSTLPNFPPGFNAVPPPTVFPPDAWGPHPMPTPIGIGPVAAGRLLTLDVVKGITIQLPPDVYVKEGWSGSGECATCPGPGAWLAVLNKKSTVIVAREETGIRIWNPDIAPGEEGVFDWLYTKLGVAKGSEIFTGPSPYPTSTPMAQLAQQPPPPPYNSDGSPVTSTLPNFPPGFNAIPPPTVFPPDAWGPHPMPTTTGPTTAGHTIDVVTDKGYGRKTIQLPPDVYIIDSWVTLGSSGNCPCPGGPGVFLGILNKKSTVMVVGTEIWDPVIAPGEEGVFDWLYQALGVAKGQEMHSGPVANAK